MALTDVEHVTVSPALPSPPSIIDHGGKFADGLGASLGNHAVAHGEAPDHSHEAEYPFMVYKVGDPSQHKAVANDKEHKAALDSGWTDNADGSKTVEAQLELSLEEKE